MKPRTGLTLSLTLACLAAGVLCASVLADTPPPTAPADTATPPATVVPDGVTLGGVAVGGMSADGAVQAVLQAFDRPIVVRTGTTRITKIEVTPEQLGTTVYADSAVAKALTVPPNTTLGLRAAVSKQRVVALVAKLAARFDRKPVDSQLRFRNSKPVVTKSRPGLRVEQGVAVAALTDQLEHGTRTPLVLPAKTLPPRVADATVGPVIVIRRSTNVLTLYKGARVERRFEVATGQTVYPTPLGLFHIVVKWKNPWWYPPASPWAKGEKPAPPGPGNPLGTRWMGISSPGVGIHGTPEDGSIGYSLSHGCIRMHIPQAEWLFDHVDVGTPVYIVAA